FPMTGSPISHRPPSRNFAWPSLGVHDNRLGKCQPMMNVIDFSSRGFKSTRAATDPTGHCSCDSSNGASSPFDEKSSQKLKSPPAHPRLGHAVFVVTFGDVVESASVPKNG